SRPLFAEDREARARVLAAPWTGHARIPPAAATAGAEEKAAAGRQVLARNREVAELRRSAARGAVQLVAHSRTGGGGLGNQRLEHRPDGRPRQEPIDHGLVVAVDPGRDELARISAVEPKRD